MRLITFKLYRAFPELDDYSDEQCVELMRRVRRNLGSQALVYAAAVGAFLLAAVMTCVAFSLIDAAIKSAGVDVKVRGEIIGVTACSSMVAIPALAALLVRDILLRRTVYRAVRLYLDHVRCPRCNYLLLGQRAVDGAVRCPECGTSTTLAALRITAQDLIPPTDASSIGKRE